MSRISSQSFKVNSDLEQLVAITNTSAIPVADSTAQASLSSIASNTTGLAGAISGSEVQVDIVSAPTLAVSNAGLTALSGAISGSEVQCDIVSPIQTSQI